MQQDASGRISGIISYSLPRAGRQGPVQKDRGRSQASTQKGSKKALGRCILIGKPAFKFR
jgi:hypothetical protein